MAASGAVSQRVVWPFALVYFDQSRVLMCWCELRDDLRNFRTDRITYAKLLDARCPTHRRALLQQWRKSEHATGRNILPESDSNFE
jgi:predicted DNA-binding transcriptional regulator YafY